MTNYNVRDQLWKALGAPQDRVLHKKRKVLESWAQEFIRQSSFVVLSTSDIDGQIIVSPRGGEVGFVTFRQNELLIPDYVGNNLFETIGNVLRYQLELRKGCPIGLLFFIPGVNELLRVIGVAKVCTLKEDSVSEITCIEEIVPGQYSIIVKCEQWYYHCAKAIKKSGIWDTVKIQSIKDNPPISKRP